MSLLEISVLPGKGRCYIATTYIPVGTVIHVSEPLATTVSQEWTPETCLWCFDFAYPKKQKIKAVTEQDKIKLSNEWSVPKKNLAFKDMLFCSENCKLNCQNLLKSEWVPMLAIHYRLDCEFKNTCNVPTVKGPIELEFSKWIDINNDEALSAWLNNAWTCLTEDLDIYREVQNTDRSMCRLIAACILRKQNSKDYNLSPFQDLLVIQNNELSHFKTHFDSSLYPNHPQQLPLHCTKEVYLSMMPDDILDVMALYCFFARTLTKPLHKVPVLSDISHELFRSIFFRERANSFGLWEMSNDEVANASGGVSDDLELLGFGIYPSAVYFNHSCDANVIKVRDGRSMKFISRRMIDEGEEACISYGSVDDDVHNRRQRLLEHYHFLCQCIRCIQEDLIIR
ncbi:hypothetical protein INT48_000072 [Thamnidium elegans]|uniref:SET domain-containing protein n=1 Tax=Thamnidium elegans TaxID=101142 RepID=A0A8H7VTN9_9FUNG|nr:hypothetical protein INT48_000072 [Thamnidium elegans]